MAIKYVSTTGSDANGGTSPADAWLTINKAILTAAPAAGTVIKVAPGTYARGSSIMGIRPTTNGTVGASPHVYDSTTWITLMRDDAYPPSAGEAIIAGAGAPSCITLFGLHYWQFDGLTFTNDGGHAFANVATSAIDLFDGVALPTGENNGCHHINITNCNFRDVNRNLAYPGNTGYGAPIVMGSYANTPAAPFPTGCHHIKITDCNFYDSLMSTPDISHSNISGAGNIYDILVSGCSFFCTRIPVNDVIPSPIGGGGVGYEDCQGGVEIGGNQLPIATPVGPYRMVISNNRFDYEQTNMAGAIYTSACFNTLIERNYVRNCTYPFGLNAEMGSLGALAQKTDKVWCRDNIINGGTRTVYAMSMGAYGQAADIYQNTKRTTFSNNTIDMDGDLSGGFAALNLVNNATPPHVYGFIGVENDCEVINNIVSTAGNNVYITPTALSANLLDYNLYASDAATPYFWLTALTATFPYDASQEQHSIHASRATPLFQPGFTGSDAYHLIENSVVESAATDPTPAWYTPGDFGDYEPSVYLDFYGEPRVAPWDMGAAIYRDPQDLLAKTTGAGALRIGSNAGPVITALAADPTAGGMEGPAGSLGLQADGTLWHKFSTGYTAWRSLTDSVSLAAAVTAVTTGTNPITALVASGTIKETGVISPTAVAGANADYAPTGLATAAVIRQDVSAVASLSGLTGGADGRIVTIYNIATAAANLLTLKHQDAASTAANRFIAPAGVDYVIPVGGCVALRYDGTTSRWRVLSASASFALPQIFTYTASGAEGSDFTVTLPAARPDDNYTVTGACNSVASILGLSFPDTAAGDRTTTTFRVITTAALTASDKFDFQIMTRG